MQISQATIICFLYFAGYKSYVVFNIDKVPNRPAMTAKLGGDISTFNTTSAVWFLQLYMIRKSMLWIINNDMNKPDLIAFNSLKLVKSVYRCSVWCMLPFFHPIGVLIVRFAGTWYNGLDYQPCWVYTISQSPCTALTTGFYLPLGLRKGNVSELQKRRKFPPVI